MDNEKQEVILTLRFSDEAKKFLYDLVSLATGHTNPDILASVSKPEVVASHTTSPAQAPTPAPAPAPKPAPAPVAPEVVAATHPNPEVRNFAQAISEVKPKGIVSSDPDVVPAKYANITIDDIRVLLSEKVANHRDSIKVTLEGFGAPSVTKLDPTFYNTFYTFLTTLA